MCKNAEMTNTIKYLILTLKYIIPIILLIIGFIKLVLTTNTKKAIKKFAKYLLFSIIICAISFISEKQINNKCKTYNNNAPKEEIKQEEIKKTTIDNTQTSIKEENKIENIDGITYIDGIMIVNKTYSLPETYEPSNAFGTERCNECLTQETMNAFREMQSDAQAINLNIYVASGYRSYNYQKGLYNSYVQQDGQDAADTYSARPGHSEHQTGLAFDLNTIDDSFAYTEEGKWIKDNCYKYGFIIRYPKGKEEKTGYQYESWHLRYVGKELAEKLYNNGEWITLEEYYNLTSIYQ